MRSGITGAWFSKSDESGGQCGGGTLAFIGRGIEHKNGDIIAHCANRWCDHTWNAVCSSGHPAIGRMSLC